MHSLPYSSFFQCVCTLGYCLLPLAIVLLTSRVLLSFDSLPNVVFIVRMALNGVALVWSIWGMYMYVHVAIPMYLSPSPVTLYVCIYLMLNQSLFLSLPRLSFCLSPSLLASLGFLSDYLPEDRKALAIYPLILFYFSISCLIATQKTGLF